MKISYNWLKDYLDINIDASKLSEILTDIGLEVEGMEKFEAVKGGLEGFLIGKVITCEKHPNANKLSITTVDVGRPELLNIVCGAPNVASGQKVVVATVGSTIYMDDDSFKIKKSKIRGEQSEGMICAEDELGVGSDHDGILVLKDDPNTGLPAKNYFNLPDDIIFEIGLTPNRIDAASHYGVARDLAAYLSQDNKVKLLKPSVAKFKVDNNSRFIDVEVENLDACHRYSGLTISGIKISETPDWIKNKLKSIGLAPINNVVDITNFVLHETGQPLHAFDADMISGDKVIVKTLNKGTKFITLDEEERELDANDLMICNSKEGMCIAGVFGGLTSGVSEKTTSIFLESAYFNPVSVRKTSKRHGLNTDSSFRFERGTDPNITIYALKRAAMLIKELAGGEISSEIVDVYPNPINDFPINVNYSNINRLIGNDIDKETVKHILQSLDITITNETDEGLSLLVPPYRVDVKREADIIEEILRIYGYNFVAISNHVNSTITHYKTPDEHKVKNTISNMLSNKGFNEIMSNSLTKKEYYTNLESYNEKTVVTIHNPLSNDLNVMRQNLLFGGLEAIAYNTNRKSPDLKLYEYGTCYFMHEDGTSNNVTAKYYEQQHLGIFLSGNKVIADWQESEVKSSFYDIKSSVDIVLSRMGVDINKIETEEFSNDLFAIGLRISYRNSVISEYGIVNENLLKTFGISDEVYYADILWDKLFKAIKKHSIRYEEITKFPTVKRDLALLLNANIKFEEVKKLAYKTEKKLLRNISIFDIYQGDKIPDGKKSYAISLVLQDTTKTLNDKYIDKITNNLIRVFEKELGAEIRK